MGTSDRGWIVLLELHLCETRLGQDRGLRFHVFRCIK